MLELVVIAAKGPRVSEKAPKNWANPSKKKQQIRRKLQTKLNNHAARRGGLEKHSSKQFFGGKSGDSTCSNSLNARFPCLFLLRFLPDQRLCSKISQRFTRRRPAHARMVHQLHSPTFGISKRSIHASRQRPAPPPSKMHGGPWL